MRSIPIHTNIILSDRQKGKHVLMEMPARFESDFMVQYMRGTGYEVVGTRTYSQEAQAVLDAGREIWKKYFELDMNYSIREEFMLNRADVGWYQIRQAIKRYNENGENLPMKMDNFEEAYKTLTEKLRPLVYEFGFLRQ